MIGFPKWSAVAEQKHPRRLKQWWTDNAGQRWRVPNGRDRLRPHQIAGHGALRAFVFQRDSNRCVRCGSAEPLALDHIVSRRNGGTHHPTNLQTLCKRCNDSKATHEDRSRGVPALRTEVAQLRARVAQLEAERFFRQPI
jgi:hypothetical protein